ncbi:hypothetical protein [Cryobacterium zhongshanensis]|uniref:Uncharacterized protein n=1 Tax=Cryobacterium zhongshanensis TaxID=2928153 RepID=A0AA41QZF8_9MICO|nr:hypothetical protein [Cryobacterium zhongshanensis]MCI4659629.1 hypothetical protein [Cryobacterium zhongshanensis]
MTSRTVMAARVSHASLRSGGRSVYICAPVAQATSPEYESRIDAVLAKLIRFDDRLLYPSQPGDTLSADSVVAFGEKHGLFTYPMSGENSPPDLVIVIVDPLGGNPLSAAARLLAMYQRADLIVSELPVHFD